MIGIPFSNQDDIEIGLSSGNTFIIQRISELLASSRNVVLISPRGWLLKSLVYKIGIQLQSEHQDLRICHLDLKLVSNQMEFERTLFDGISSISRPEDRYRICKFTSHSSILNLPERFAAGTHSRILILIHNFHIVLRFDKNQELQKSIRWHWRSQKKIAFCIYGENLESYYRLFRKPRSPLITFAKFYQLKRIDSNELAEYIRAEFEKSGKRINGALTQQITRITDDHPFYARILAKEIWIRTKSSCNEEILHSAIGNILEQYSLHFYRITDRLTNIQIRFLKALLCEEPQLCSAETLSRYQLGTSAHVSRCRQNLERHEILFNDRLQVRFTDPMYRLWLKSCYFELPDLYY